MGPGCGGEKAEGNAVPEAGLARLCMLLEAFLLQYTYLNSKKWKTLKAGDQATLLRWERIIERSKGE